MAVNMKIIFVWDMIPHILLEMYQCFGGTYMANYIVSHLRNPFLIGVQNTRVIKCKSWV
jgi:hypothetical protein